MKSFNEAGVNVDSSQDSDVVTEEFVSEVLHRSKPHGTHPHKKDPNPKNELSRYILNFLGKRYTILTLDDDSSVSSNGTRCCLYSPAIICEVAMIDIASQCLSTLSADTLYRITSWTTRSPALS